MPTSGLQDATKEYEKMIINLTPDHNMWLTTMSQDLNEDDIDEYDRLVIDIPDPPDSATCTTMKNETSVENGHFYEHTDLRDGKSALETEKTISSSTHNTTEPTDETHKLLPLRISRDIPIKLLLKRTFQNNIYKPHEKPLKMYKAEEEKEQLLENNKTELLLTSRCNSNPLEIEEANETFALADGSQIISPQATVIVSSKKYNALNKLIDSHREELSSAGHEHNLNQTEDKVNQKDTAQNYINHTASVAAAEKLNTIHYSVKHHRQKLLSTYKNYSNQEIKQNRTCNVVDNIIQRTSQKHMKLTVSSPMTREKQNTLNVSVESKKEELLDCQKNYSGRVENQDRPHIILDNIDLTVTPQDLIMKLTTSAVIPEEQNSVQDSSKSYKKSISTQRHHLSQVEQERTVIAHSSQKNNKKNNEEYTLDVQIKSSQFCQTQKENKHRISVVSNDFLFQDHSRRETLKKNCRTNQTRKNKGIKCPQKYQEALIDFMERHYQLALRENIPLTVNSRSLHQETQKEIPNTMFTEVINVGQKTQPQDITKEIQSQENSSSFIYENMKKTRNCKKKTNSENDSGYNILVHRGPDINRIVITIANDNEENNQNISCQSPCGDQRVPESHGPAETIINNILHSEPSQKKRSYYYKEPSLRSFRKRLSSQYIQKQIRNTVENSRFDSPDHLDNYNNIAYAQHYSYIGNHYELPTPVIENYYTFEPLPQNYLCPVANALYPLEVYDRRPVLSPEEISRRSINTMPNIPSSPTQYIDSYNEQILFRPLNLSLKPQERPYPEFYPRYPVQDYY